MEQLRWRDVDTSTAQAIVHGKGGTLKAVALSDRLLEALSSLRASGGTKSPAKVGFAGAARRSGYVLPYSASRAYQRFGALCKRLGIDARGLHALRHTAGTRLYQQHGDLGQVQDHLRHAHIDTTRIYASGSTGAIRKAIKGW